MVQEQLDREELVNYCRSLFQGKLIRKPSHICSDFAATSTDLYPEELMEEEISPVHVEVEKNTKLLWEKSLAKFFKRDLIF